MNDTKPFIKFIKNDNVEQMLRKYSEVAIRASFSLYIHKNKERLSDKHIVLL